MLLWKLYLATPLGLSLYAAGENQVGAYRAGVTVGAARIVAYAISGLLCTGAGLFVAAQTGSGDPVIGTAFTLNSIAAAVLGGVGFLGGSGTMRGAIAGSLLLSVMINVMFFLGFPPVAQYVAQGLIIIGAVALPRFTQRAEDRMSAAETRHAFRRGGSARSCRAGRSSPCSSSLRSGSSPASSSPASAPSAISATWSSSPR